VPQWVLDAMPDLPSTMQEAGHRASMYEHAITDLVEAELLKGGVGERFTGVVLEADHDDPRKGKVQIAEPAVEATVTGEDALPVGAEVEVVLAVADPATRKVEFRL
jgi:exoribonuclease R